MEANEELRIVLLRTALALLEDEGSVPSLRTVARAANVSAMSPYRHFEDKAALLAAVADRGFALLGDALMTADRSMRTPTRVRRSMARASPLRGSHAHPALFRLMLGPTTVMPEARRSSGQTTCWNGARATWLQTTAQPRSLPAVRLGKV